MTRTKIWIVLLSTGMLALGAGIGAAAQGRPPIEGVGGLDTLQGIISDTTSFTTSSTSWVDVPAANLQVRVVNSWQPAMIFARFNASAACSGAGGTDRCAARITIDGVEANPAAGTDAAFTQSPDFMYLSMDRWLTGITPGNRDIRVQVAVTDPSLQLTVSHWTLNVDIRPQKFPAGG